MIYVFAGNYREFAQWCIDDLDMSYKLAERRHFAAYIRDSYFLNGRQNIQIIKYGTWYARSDRRQIEEQITWLRNSGALR